MAVAISGFPIAINNSRSCIVRAKSSGSTVAVEYLLVYNNIFAYLVIF